jgi:hypothetical protein
MLKVAIFSFACLTLLPRNVISQTCASAMPYVNMRYLTPTQLTQYQLTDPCSITCQTGYYGEFCEPNTKYTVIPQGPWNSKGYYTIGNGIHKSMTLDVSALTQISYTSSDSTLVGVFRQQLTRSAVMLISLTSRSTKTVWTAQTGGYIDALQVRNGKIYMARSTTQDGPYDISILTGDLQAGPYTASLFMPITYRASMIEPVEDKGMNTTFIYTPTNKILSCTPDQVCRQWYSGAGVTGMVCGIDCPNSLYISVYRSILRLTDNGVTITQSTLITQTSNINCLSGIPKFNTFLYRVGVNVKQLSITASTTSTYNALLTLSIPTNSVCSLDVSESNAQIILVENGVINTLEALQQPCDYQLTSPSVVSTTHSNCIDCPPPPTNAYLVVGSVTCQWQCYSGYTQLVSQCIKMLTPPCPARHIAVNGVCIASTMPWVPSGSFVSGVTESSSSQMTQGVSGVTQPIKITAGGTLSFMASSQKLFVSNSFGASWQIVTPTLNLLADSQCGYNTNNRYTMLEFQDNTLFVGFALRGITPIQNCLWLLDTSTLKAGPPLSGTLSLVQYWPLGGQLCSIARGIGQTVYLLICNMHYILQSSLTDKKLTVFAGQTRAGYVDGDVQSSWFSSPSSLAFYNQRLYIADTGNCVIREIDVVRNTMGVVAGVAGTCQRQDGSASGLRRPSLLTHTIFEGFFLFLDQGSDESYPMIRQFHAPTGQVQTIRRSSLAQVSKLLGFADRIQVASGENYDLIYDIKANFSICTEGSMSLEGGAYAVTDCVGCGSGFYSSGGACVSCSSPNCTFAGQMTMLCAGNNDSYCGQCTNRPTNTPSRYTGPATAYDSGSDCPWVYLAPCPIGMYSAIVSGATYCVNCPPWATTSAVGRTNIYQCICLGQGTFTSDKTCVVPSPYITLPGVCPPLTACSAATYNAFPFPIQATCSSSITDTQFGVCRCQPGEFISQVYPKQCDTCPDHLYSPVGESCVRCPPYGEPSLDHSACRCVAGTSDVDLADDVISCVCGEGSGFGAVKGCYKCGVNQYSATTLTLSLTPWTQSKACIPCAMGTWADPGAAQCSPCPTGTYRDATVEQCSQCPTGQYATNPASSAYCINCQTACGGRKQTQCPTDPSLFVCVDCPPVRANAAPNGLDDCATTCIEGHYELDGECVACTLFDATSCPSGNALVQCGLYSDAACVACVNASKPLYYAQWVGASSGPSKSCAWECMAGYTAKALTLPVMDGDSGMWICAKENTWSIFDMFTV